jgi:hypothetical protein
MEMTVLVAALGIATLWIAGEARGEYYRMGRAATTMVVMSGIALQAYVLRPVIVLDPLYLPEPLVTTIQLLIPYLMLLQITRGCPSTPICAGDSATQLWLPDTVPSQLELLEQKQRAVPNLTLPRYGH